MNSVYWGNRGRSRVRRGDDRVNPIGWNVEGGLDHCPPAPSDVPDRTPSLPNLILCLPSCFSKATHNGHKKYIQSR